MNKDELIGILVRNHNWSKGTFEIWNEAGFRCVYCGMNHLGSLDAYKLAKLDHILPQAKYPGLRECQKNLVLSCDTCNNLKRNWDPNLQSDEGDAVVAANVGSLSTDDRTELLARAKRYVVGRRVERERLFLREKEMILRWLSDGQPAGKPS